MSSLAFPGLSEECLFNFIRDDQYSLGTVITKLLLNCLLMVFLLEIVNCRSKSSHTAGCDGLAQYLRCFTSSQAACNLSHRPTLSFGPGIFINSTLYAAGSMSYYVSIA